MAESSAFLKPTILEKLAALPQSPGVYKYLDSEGRIIYIGKAKNLKNRVRTYFQDTAKLDSRIHFLIAKIEDVEWTITLTESDALVLEDKLIKIHQPRYNSRLKDNKTYPYIKITTKELFPRLFLTRQLTKDGSHYYGPYSNVLDARMAINAIRRYFPLRSTNLDLDGTKTFKPCLNYQLKRCLAPCTGQVKVADYQLLVHRVEKMLKGNFQALIHEMTLAMQARADAMEYEAAAKLRNSIQAVENALKIRTPVKVKSIDADVFWIERQEGFAGVQILFIRGGIVFSTDFDFLKNGDEFPDEDLLRSYLSRLYIKNSTIYPKLILLPTLTEELAILADFLKKEKQENVRVAIPSGTDENKLLALAAENAKANMKLYLQSAKVTDTLLAEVKDYLQLNKLPERVECIDISHLAGQNTTASLVVFQQNAPKKEDYKHFKVKLVKGIDDFASIFEVLSRRAARAKTGEWPWPDLLIIDGGIGQLHSAISALDKANIEITFDMIGLAKGRSVKKRIRGTPVALEQEWDFEYVVKSPDAAKIALKKSSPTLHFLQRVRDEAHRFAIKHQRNSARKNFLFSELDGIKGIGQSKKKKLLLAFRSIDEIAQASVADLSAVPGLNKHDLEKLLHYFGRALPDSITELGKKKPQSV